MSLKPETQKLLDDFKELSKRFERDREFAIQFRFAEKFKDLLSEGGRTMKSTLTIEQVLSILSDTFHKT